MKKMFLLFSLLIVFFSCQDEIIKEQSINGAQNDESQELTRTNELSEPDAKQLLEICINQLDKKSQLRSSSGKIIISNSKKNYIEININSNLRLANSNKNTNDKDSIAIYNFIIENGDNDGFGLVLGDKRFPQVLSYASIGSLNDTLYNEGLKKWVNSIPEYVESLYNNHNSNNNSYDIDSLLYEVSKKDEPIGGQWPCVRDSVRLGNISEYWWGVTWHLSNAYFKVSNYQNNINKILPTQWDQSAPYNNNMQFFPISCNLPGQRIFTGCVTTAIAQLMAYYEWPQTYNWALLKQTPRISTWSQTSQVSEAARLMKNVQDMLSPTVKCDGTGVERSKTNSVMSRYFN